MLGLDLIVVGATGPYTREIYLGMYTGRLIMIRYRHRVHISLSAAVPDITARKHILPQMLSAPQ